MATGSNTPENATATPAASESYDLTTEEGRAKVPTQITIKGKTFELKDMSVASAQELYGLLEADDQARATGLASFIQNFKAPLLSELPETLQQPGKIQEFVSALQAGGGKVTESTPEWVKKIASEATTTAAQAPGADHVRNIMSAISTAQSAAGTVASVAGEAKDWVMLLPRATEYLITSGREKWNTTGEQPTADQALAMGTAYQGSLVASRREAGFMDKANARMEQAGSWIANSSAGMYVSAFFTALSSWISGEGFNFNEALAAAQASKTESRSYEQILNENLEQPVQAAARLRNAGEVADRSTTAVADTLEAASTNGAALFVNAKDEVEAINESNQTAPVNGPDGNPIKAADINVERQKEVLGNIGKNGFIIGAAGAVVGIPATYKLGKGAMQGFANRYWGDANGAVARANSLADKSDKLLDRAAKVETGGRFIGPKPEKAEKLLGAAEALADKSDDAAKMAEARMGAHPKLNAFGNGAATDLGRRINPLTWPERAGRRIGGLAGAVTEPAMAKLETGARALGSGLDRIPGLRPAGGLNIVDAPEAPAKAPVAAAAHVAEEVVEEVAVKEAGVFARWGGRALRIGGKFVRALPIVGAIATTGGVLMASAARAETVNGEKLTGPEQLARDLEMGRITQAEYYAWKSVQVGYAASGLLGIVGGGVVEAIQTGGEHLDGSKVGRYLPPSIVADVEGMIAESKSGKTPAPKAPATPDEGMAAAVTDQTVRAQSQAHRVFASVKEVRQQSGETVTLADLEAGNSPIRLQFGSSLLLT